MTFPRLQLFEFNDLSASPRFIRDTVVESLSNTLAWGGMLSGLVDPLDQFLKRAGTRDILDIGAGAGGPAAILVREFMKQGREPPRFLLTDLHPRPEKWAALREQLPGAIDFVATPVDATAVPAELARGRVRTIVNVFHHFPPSLAAAILRSATRDGRGVFIAEAFERTPWGFVRMWPFGVPALLANPFLTRSDRIAKAVSTYALPLVLGVGLWDGFVSTMRIHSEAELRAMAAPLGADREWSYGNFTVPFGGKGYWFASATDDAS